MTVDVKAIVQVYGSETSNGYYAYEIHCGGNEHVSCRSAASVSSIQKATDELYDAANAIVKGWSTQHGELKHALLTHGAAVTDLLFDGQGVNLLWNMLQKASVLSVAGDALDGIPWELLVPPRAGARQFMQAGLVVARMKGVRRPADKLLRRQDDVRVSYHEYLDGRSLAALKFIAIDKIEDLPGAWDGKSIVAICCKAQRGSSALHLTGDGLSYDAMCAKTYQLPAGSLVFMLSCGKDEADARDTVRERHAIASAVARESMCTVLYPATLVPEAEAYALSKSFVDAVQLPAETLQASVQQFLANAGPLGRLFRLEGAWNCSIH